MKKVILSISILLFYSLLSVAQQVEKKYGANYVKLSDSTQTPVMRYKLILGNFNDDEIKVVIDSLCRNSNNHPQLNQVTNTDYFGPYSPTYFGVRYTTCFGA